MILYQMLRQSASTFRDKVALIYNEKRLSYQEFYTRVNLLQQNFAQLGIKKEIKVGLLLHNSDLLCTSLYALSKNNNITCLMNTQWNESEIERKIKIANISVVVVEDYTLMLLQEKKAELCQSIHFVTRKQLEDVLDQKQLEVEDNFTFVREDELLRKELIQSSSGTTGFSKMAYRTQKNILYDADNIVNTLHYDSEDIIYCSVPMCHGYGLTMGVIAPILCGATIIISRMFRCNHFLGQYDTLKPTIFLGIPEMYQELNENLVGREFNFKYCKWFFCSGSSMNREIGEAFYKVSHRWISQVYGMMEVSTICVNQNPSSENIESVGQAVDRVQVKVDRFFDNKEPSILVKSETISTEYIEDGKDTQIPLHDGWFNTKDMGYINEYNEVFVKGRVGEK